MTAAPEPGIYRYVSLVPSIKMKDFVEFKDDRAGIGVCYHKLFHRIPPSPAFRGAGDLVPTLLGLEFNIGEEPVGVRIEKYRVVMDAAGLQYLLKLGPYRVVTAAIFASAAGLQNHDEGFANHLSSRLLVYSPAGEKDVGNHYQKNASAQPKVIPISSLSGQSLASVIGHCQTN